MTAASLTPHVRWNIRMLSWVTRPCGCVCAAAPARRARRMRMSRSPLAFRPAMEDLPRGATTWCRASPTPRLCRSCDGARCAGCRPALWVRGWRQGRLRGLATDCELPCRAVCCFLITAIICADGNCMPSGGLLCLLHVASEMMIVDLLLQTGAQINVHLCHKCWDSEAPAPAGARDRSLQHTPGHDGRHVHAGGLHGQDRGGREPRAG